MKRINHISFSTLTLSIVLLAACAAPPTAAPAPDVNQLNTIVAETAFAAQTQSAVPGSPLRTETATSTFTLQPPTLTPTVTQIMTSTSIFTATLPAPVISVSVATNCRSGPGKVYDYKGALLIGKTAEVRARDTTGDYWLIPNPDSPGELCWVWGQYATILGDTSGLAIFTPPPTPTATFTPLPSTNVPSGTPGPNIDISYTGMDTCSGNWWVEVKLENSGAFDFKSTEIRVWDKNTDTTLSKLTDGFINVDGCGSSASKDTLPVGKSLVVSSHTFGYDLTGHALRVTVKVCTQTGQSGACVKNQIEFAP